MNSQQILDAITASEQLTALVPDTNALAAALSLNRKKFDTTTKFTSLGIAERHPSLNGLPGPLAAEAVLEKLEAFAAAAATSNSSVTKLLGSAITRQMQHLAGSGMAVGSPAIAAMLAVIVQNNGITQAEADALVSIALVDDPVSEYDVRCAIFNDNGSLKV